MTRLSHSQWDKLNRFCLDVYVEKTPEYFFKQCVEALPKLLGLLSRTAPIKGVHLSSDFVTHQEMRELPIYREAYRHVGIRQQI